MYKNMSMLVSSRISSINQEKTAKKRYENYFQNKTKIQTGLPWNLNKSGKHDEVKISNQ